MCGQISIVVGWHRHHVAIRAVVQCSGVGPLCVVWRLFQVSLFDVRRFR